MEYWRRLRQFIKEFEEHIKWENPKKDEEFFDTWELSMAKALLGDSPDSIVRVAKIILAQKDVGDIKVRIE